MNKSGLYCFLEKQRGNERRRSTLPNARFPAKLIDPTYTPLKQVATTLAQRAPGACVLGGYWDTYVLAGLQTQGTIIPVPAEDQYVRTPWTPQLMRAAREVLVVQHDYQNFGGREPGEIAEGGN